MAHDWGLGRRGDLDPSHPDGDALATRRVAAIERMNLKPALTLNIQN